MKYTLTIEGTPAELGKILAGGAAPAATTAAPPKTGKAPKPPKEEDDDVNFDVDDAPAEDDAGGDDDDAPAFTIDQVRAALGKWAKGKGSPEKAKKLLKKLGADTLPELDEEKYPELMKTIGAAK